MSASKGEKTDPVRRRLTKRTIDALPAPTDCIRVAVFDVDLRGLCVRVSNTGSKVFYFYRKVNGRPVRVKLGAYPDVTPEAARVMVQRIASEFAQGRDPVAERRRRRQPDRTDPTLGVVFDHTLEHHWKPNCRTWKEQKRLFETYSASWKSRRLAAVTKVDVLEMHRKLGKEHGRYLANRWRGVLHRLFEVAADDFDFAGGNPVKKVKPFGEQERERFVTAEEIPRLFDAIDAAEDSRIADFLRIALMTGARKGAILRMRYADVDFARAVWTIPPSDSKNKRSVSIALVPEILELIRARSAKSEGHEYVFPGRGGVGHWTDPKKPLGKVFTAAGFKDVRLHDLRRTFGSWQAADGSSLLLIGKSLGHLDSRSTRVYARVTLDPVRQSVERATKAMLGVVQADRARRETLAKKQNEERE
jgi:integrase